MSEAALTAPIAPAGSPSLSTVRRNYILFILTLVGTVNFLDRQILNILIEPIRKELSLSDTQIGFLVGIAFTFVYVTLGIPVARLADSWSRRKVIALSVGVWSLMTAVCGVARTFPLLLLARVGVGIGQAGGSSPCQAFVGDLFPREVRSTAMGIFLLSVPLGIGTGLVMGGWAVGQFGWRGTYILAGIPGLILAPLVYFTIPEIRKGLTDGARKDLAAPPFASTIRLLASIASFRNMMLASTFQTFLSLGMSAWFPSFLARSHGMNPKAIGIGLALAFALPHAFAAVIGGRMTDVLARRDLRWYFWIPAVAGPVGGAFAACAFVAPVEYVFWFMSLSLFLFTLQSGPIMVIAQGLAPIAFRATVSAVMLFVVISVGMGLGPQAVGIVSDLLRPAFGNESLRMTLLFATALAIPVGYFNFRASLTYRADMAAAEARDKA